jgi:hypothetical protein
MPVYNAAEYLAAAIDSIAAQTFGDFEFLIVDDGSTDASPQILASYAERDKRITIIRSDANRGLTDCLNQGLALARGAYIARMDGDDISLPERLARQVSFLEGNPRVGDCGTWIQTIGELGGRVERYPSSHADIRCELLFKDVLAHPSVMIRRSVLAEHGLAYDPAFYQAQDYDLWVRVAEHAELANLPEVLLHYRMHQQQIGQRQQGTQVAAAGRVRRAQLASLGLRPTAHELALHEAISTARFTPTHQFIRAAEAWLQGILDASRHSARYPDAALASAVGLRWYTICRLSTALGPWAWWCFQRSPLRRGAAIGRLRLAKFALKALARSPSI